MEYKLIIMSEINTVNEQLMLLSDVVAKRDEIAAKLMERGDSVNFDTKSKNCSRSGGGGDGSSDDVGDKKIVANTKNELISVVAHQDKMKVVRKTHHAHSPPPHVIIFSRRACI